MAVTVDFHTGVADPVAFACRLLRKASRQGARLLVTAPPATLAALDTALWTFDPQDFVPHVRWPASPTVAGHTPIWLCEHDGDLPQDAPRVRVNLGADAPASTGGVDRVIEIVGIDADDRAAGRARWRHYEQDWGVKPTHYAVS